MKEAKKGICEKCGKYFYLHEHHILPKAIFNGVGETANLCPNCHTHFHEYSKKKLKNTTDEEATLRVWKYWIKHVVVIVSIIIIALLLVY